MPIDEDGLRKECDLRGNSDHLGRREEGRQVVDRRGRGCDPCICMNSLYAYM